MKLPAVVTDEFLVALVAVLGGALLAAATLAGAYLLRRVHELGERMIALENVMERFKLLEQDMLLDARHKTRRRRGME